jgi:hypothetical protein
VSQEERCVFKEVIVSAILSKKNAYVPTEPTIGLRGVSGVWIFGRPYRCGGLLWYGDNFNCKIFWQGFINPGLQQRER